MVLFDVNKQKFANSWRVLYMKTPWMELRGFWIDVTSSTLTAKKVWKVKIFGRRDIIILLEESKDL